MAIAEIKWKLVKDTYFFDTTTCYLSEDGNHLFYVGKEKRIEILINDLNELVRKGCAVWLELGEYEFGLDKLSKCPTTTWYGIHQMLYSLEPWGVMKESKKSSRKSIKESVEFSKEKDIYIAQIKDSSISFAYTPIDTDDDFNGYFVFDGDDVIEYLNWKGADANDMLKAFDDFEKAVKKYTSKGDAKIIIKDFHNKLGI